MASSTLKDRSNEAVCCRSLAASFRDPAGRLFTIDARVLRVVTPAAQAILTDFLSSKAARNLVETGRLVATKVLDAAQADSVLTHFAVNQTLESFDGQMVIEHEPMPFLSFPYEWPPEMLWAAGMLTIDIAQELLDEGFYLKDATPYNVLFRGSEPVFVDLLSIERADPAEPTWLPYAQFVRTFLLPLLANKHFGLRLDHILTTARDGLEPEEVYRWSTPLQKLTPPFLTLATIPTWLGSLSGHIGARLYRKKSVRHQEKAWFILHSLLGRLRRTLRALKPRERKDSAWSDYKISKSYTPEQFAAKQTFVSEAISQFLPRNLLDVGCNTGHFSLLAAEHGARVVAIDFDPVAVGQLWHSVRAQGLDILPLVLNLARPSPALGWRNQECPAFLDRARGAFDAVLMLAVIHHLLVTERIPLPEIIDLASELTTGLLVIEFIAPDDPMFLRIIRGRDSLHSGLTPAVFEAAIRQRFDVIRSQQLSGSRRWLYLLCKRKS